MVKTNAFIASNTAHFGAKLINMVNIIVNYRAFEVRNKRVYSGLLIGLYPSTGPLLSEKRPYNKNI